MPKRKAPADDRDGNSPVFRGGRHQRKAAADAKAQKEKKVEAIATIGGVSPCVYKLLEHWSWGSSSALEICDLARSVKNTFGAVPQDLNALASCGSYGHQPSNTQRDLLRLEALQNLKAPDPYYVSAWVIQNPGTRPVLVKEDIAIFLPHEWGHALSQHGLLDCTVGEMADIKEFWKQVSNEDPKLYKNPVLKENRENYMPFVLHADKGPHAKQDSLHTISMYSLIAQARRLGVDESSFMLCAIPNSCLVTTKKCKDLSLANVEPTMDTIGKVLAWSFKAWFAGLHPFTDAFGHPLLQDRLAKAGQRICQNGMRCIIWALPADCEHNSVEYGLPNYNSNSPCMRCKCNRSDTPWNDFNHNADWRSKPYTKQEVHDEPMTSHWVLSIPGVNHWTFAYDFMHCADLGFSSASVANVFYDVVYKHLPGRKRSEKIAQLLDLVHQAYDDLGITEGRISKLALSHFCDADAPHQHYPDLMHSATKAKQTAYLVPVCLKLCEKFNDGSDYCMWRHKCLKHLCNLCKISEEADLFFTHEEFRQYDSNVHKFLQYYNKLSYHSYSLDNARVGHFQWGQIPKMHFLCHISEDAQFLNPRAVWAYPGEHLVGNATKLAAACLAGLQPYQVPNTICKKYQIGKHLQFQQQA